jgi:hypothetical protein
MATQPSVETVSTGADKAKLAVAALLVVGAMAAFYVLGKQDLWLRVDRLLVVLAAAVAMFFTSEPGKQLIGFGRESVREDQEGRVADAQGSDADDRLRHGLRLRDGLVHVRDRQDAGMGAVRPDPGLEALRTPRNP